MRVAELLCVVVAAGFASSCSPLQAQTSTEPVPVLAELFTAEGCNSCPPADTLLEVMIQEQPIKGVQIIALSEHVTYWDNQGWKDPFDSPQFTARQEQYGRRFNLDSVFTPQLIVDGTQQFVGSDKNKIEAALIASAKTPKPALAITVTSEGAVINASASGPGLTAEKDAELMFALAEDHLSVDVKRGENANRTLRHSGVVRILQSAGSVDATSKKVMFKLAPDWKRENLRVVGFVQSKKNRRIISVGSAKP